jgi:hypothetical protein
MPKLGYAAYTPHGFRATYRTWATEIFKVRDYGHEIVEQVLAHKIRDKAEAAYARAEALVPRRKLMDEWPRRAARWRCSAWCPIDRRKAVRDRSPHRGRGGGGRLKGSHSHDPATSRRGILGRSAPLPLGSKAVP